MNKGHFMKGHIPWNKDKKGVYSAEMIETIQKKQKETDKSDERQTSF